MFLKSFKSPLANRSRSLKKRGKRSLRSSGGREGDEQRIFTWSDIDRLGKPGRPLSFAESLEDLQGVRPMGFHRRESPGGVLLIKIAGLRPETEEGKGSFR